MVRGLKTFVVLLIVMLLVVSCNSKKEGAEHNGVHRLPNGDLQEKTASVNALPNFLNDQSKEVRQAYQLAAQNHDLLQWVPCYCGCGESAGHRSNQNCFIKEVNADGSVVWDDHGTRCGVCLQTALESVVMKQKGQSAEEIRMFIDEKYKKGYAKPTATPMPS